MFAYVSLTGASGGNGGSYLVLVSFCNAREAKHHALRPCKGMVLSQYPTSQIRVSPAMPGNVPTSHLVLISFLQCRRGRATCHPTHYQRNGVVAMPSFTNKGVPGNAGHASHFPSRSDLVFAVQARPSNMSSDPLPEEWYCRHAQLHK